MSKLTKRERYYQRNKQKFNSSGLSREEIHKFPPEKRLEYVHRELNKKYKTDQIKCDCVHCCLSALFEDGYVSDEELRRQIGK